MNKRIILLLILILSICSCSSTKENLQAPVSTYLSSKLNNNDTIIIITNKINNNYAIDLFKTKSITPVNINTLENSVILKDPTFHEKYWDIMNKKYRNDKTNEIWLKSVFWNQNNFKNIKIKFIEEDVFPKPSTYNEYMTEKKSEVTVFAFSDPIFYKNNKYAIFAKSETTTKKQFIIPNSIVIMKMKNGKWKFLKEINDGSYY